MHLIEGRSRTKSGYILDHFIPGPRGTVRDVHAAWLVREGETETCTQPSGEVMLVGTIATLAMLVRMDWDERTLGKERTA